jgi:ABC-type sugar transport system ATPase subunit
MNLLNLGSIRERSFLVDACNCAFTSDGDSDGFIGVRPEHVRISRSGLPVRVCAVDYLGAETLVRLEHDGQYMFARTEGRTRLKSEEALHVSWPEEEINYFDSEGLRIDKL